MFGAHYFGNTFFGGEASYYTTLLALAEAASGSDSPSIKVIIALLDIGTAKTKGLQFDGSTNYLLLANAAILGGQTNAGVFLRMNATTGGNPGAPLYCERAPSGNDIYKIELTNTGVIRFTFRDDGGSLSQPTGSTVLTDGKNHTIVFSKAGTAIKIYLDGNTTPEINNTVGVSDNFTNTSMQVRLGSDAGDGSSWYTGVLDQILLYRRTPTIDDVIAYQNNQTVNATSLVGSYFLDEGIGTTTADSSATRGTATLSSNGANIPIWVTGLTPEGIALLDAISLVESGEDGAIQYSNNLLGGSIPTNWVATNGSTWTYSGSGATQASKPSDPNKLMYSGSDSFTLQREVYAEVYFPTAPTTNDRMGVTVLGDTSGGNGYNVLFHDGNKLQFLWDFVAFGPSVSVTIAAGDTWCVKGMYDGNGNFYGKGWLKGTSEPGWMITWAQTTTLTRSGLLGLSNDGITYPTFSNFKITTQEVLALQANLPLTDASSLTVDAKAIAASMSLADLAGASGKALQLDGSQNYVNLGNVTTLNNVGTGDFTLVSNVYLTSLPTGTGLITKQYTGGNVCFEMGFGIDSGTDAKAKIGFFNGAWYYASDTANITLNTPHKIVGTRIGSVFTIYVDGVQVGQASGGVAPATDTNSVWIGRRHDVAGNVNFIPGKIKDSRIYTRGWSQAEVTDYQNNRPISATGLVNQLLMNDGDGTTVIDSAGVANGTLVGSPLPVWTNGFYSTEIASLLDAFSLTDASGATLDTQSVATAIALAEASGVTLDVLTSILSVFTLSETSGVTIDALSNLLITLVLSNASNPTIDVLAVLTAIALSDASNATTDAQNISITVPVAESNGATTETASIASTVALTDVSGVTSDIIAILNALVFYERFKVSNVIGNSDFSLDTAGNGNIPSGWNSYGGSATYKGVANDFAFTAPNSFKINNASLGDTGIKFDFFMNQGDTYTLSADVKTDAGVSNACLVINDTTFAVNNIGASQNGRFSVSRTAGQNGTASVFLGLGSFGGQSGGTVWFDNIKLEVGGSATPYTQQVDTQSILSQIPIADVSSGSDVLTAILSTISVIDASNLSSDIASIATSLALADATLGTDSLALFTSLVINDASSLTTDSASVFSSLGISDIATGIDAVMVANVIATLLDSGSVTDAVSILQQNNLFDAAAASEIVLVIISTHWFDKNGGTWLKKKSGGWFAR